MNRRAFLSLTSLLVLPPAARAQDVTAPPGAPQGLQTLPQVLDRAGELGALKTVLVARDGVVLAERGYRGNRVTTPTNIKSASKTVMSALVGLAIDKGLLEGPDQKIAPLLRADLPSDADPRLQDITIGNLLSMQAGLDRTSGPNYGRWVASANWVRAALAQPFVDEPGGRMLYSTGSTHLLSAILTRRSGRSTRELAREWLGPLPDFAIGGWERDPQGIYLGGNQMAMSARSAGLRRALPQQRQDARWQATAFARMDRRLLAAAHDLAIQRRRLWLWLVPAQYRRAGCEICLGLRWTDALHRTGARPYRRHDVGRGQPFRPQRLPRRLAQSAGWDHRDAGALHDPGLDRGGI